MKILLYDNFDSFTHNLADYLRTLGAHVIIVNNTENKKAVGLLKKIDGVVISPGPETPYKAGGLNDFVKNCIEYKIPLLGICLGHQAIAQYYGATLVKAKIPMHGKVSEITHTNSLLYSGISSTFKVCRYHSLIITNLKEPLRSTAFTANKELMSFEHHSLPIYGVQYHPEAILTEYGLDILDNFLIAIKDL